MPPPKCRIPTATVRGRLRLVATVFAAVCLAAPLVRFRGDRAMVRRPGIGALEQIEEDVPA